jgi:hypothetical protein
MATKEVTNNGRLRSITQIAMDNQIGYHAARENVLRGLYGRVVRVGSRLYVEQPAEPEPPKAA